MDLTIHIPEDIARRLMAEATAKKMTLDQLVAQRLSAEPKPPKTTRPDYVKLAKQGSKAPGARKSLEQIDADVEAGRNEW